MSNPEPVDGKCNAKTRDGGRCAKDPMDNGRCYNHGGASTGAGDPARPGNGNAVTHHLYEDHDLLYQRRPESEQEHITEMASAMYERYNRRHGHYPDPDIEQQLKNSAIDIHKVTLSDNYMAKKGAESGHPLIEELTRFNDEGKAIDIERANKLIEIAQNLKRETRMFLKDIELLPNAETRKADAMENRADAWRSYIDMADELPFDQE